MKNKTRISKKQMQRAAMCGALALAVLVGNAQPAHAQVVFDPTMYATQLIQKIQEAFQGAIQSAGQILQTKIQGMFTDSINDNNKTLVDATHGGDIYIKYAMPSDHSYCRQAQASAASAELRKDNQAIAQAITNGGANRPNTASAIAQDIAARNGNGLCHSDKAGDTESSAYGVLGCKDPWGGEFAGADETPDAVFAHDRLLVPPEYPAPKNNVYTPPPASVSDRKYMPFVAALSYCNSINNRLPLAPQQVKGRPTIEANNIDPYSSMKAKSVTPYSMCINDLAERMQYDNTSKGPFLADHTDQATRCTADLQSGVLDSDGGCQTNGRSQLQQQIDFANRDTQKTYYVYTRNLTPDAKAADIAAAQAQKQAIQDHIEHEREALATAIAAAEATPKVEGSPMTMPASQ
ncbi:MAG: TrbC/VirB2 family protein [Alphaproteobacteria bacterium]|nr:TrbC/VirB2 family protein [Alphaproteobacteria bacterium]